MSKFSMILSEIIFGYNLFFRSCIAVFMFIINLMFDIIISLLSAILVPTGNSFVMLIYIIHPIIPVLFSLNL